VSKPDSDVANEPLLTGDARQLDSEHLRNAIRATSSNPPDSPNMDFQEFVENLLKNNPPRRRQRSLFLPTSFASEAVDAHPRPN